MSALEELDGIDRRILRALQADGRITYDVLAAHVNLSPSATLRRVKRLEESGVIAGYVALDAASPRTLAIVLAFAGGAVLTMLANTMMPEALRYGGRLAGLLTTLGFALAFAISSLQ